MSERLILITVLSVLVATLSYLIYESINEQTLLDDPVFTSAEIINTQELVRYKKGRQIKNYKYTYQYQANDEHYSGSFNVPEKERGLYTQESSIDIVYSKIEPEESVLKSNLPEKMTAWGYVKLLLKAILFAFFVTVILNVVVEKLKSFLSPSIKDNK